ncbi:polymorphic toxin type 25 domain-containing protein [Pantoea agglomerans]|uniref:polymorphic toxin type 25 domain-containing protein n=1 Tax=Enterobacter agglomerans TaxID=549 RepID=UPI0028994A7D|nr:polymorphic toxin type 25 domain-containing protein [Pantoea agglomerans]WNK39001.1 polymorphic toxin type 25 domain-containing protein [Pantoea agglomerans]
MAHAVAGAVLAQLACNNATAGAAGAAGGELMARAILSSMYPGKQASELTQEQKQVVSALGQLAAQLSAGVTSGSVEGGIQGAVAGKNAVENNALSFGTGMNSYGAAVKSWNQYAEVNGLTPEQKQAGLNRIAVGEGPSWGTEYKVKPNGKVEVSGAVGLALKGGSEINNDYLSISSGYTKEFGIKAGALIGIDFGPYFPGLFGDLNRDYSTSIGFGPGSVGMSGGKDGIGISFSIGPSIGFTGSATGSHDEKLDLNGDSTKEIYHYDFK